MSAVAVEQIELIDLSKLEVHPSNPRKQMGDLDELAASIKSAGLIEPIVAVRHNGKYQVVAGSRRLAAARKAKLDNLPVRVMDLDEAQAMAAALIENLQRKDLEPLEQAEAFRGWLTLTGKTQKDLAEVVGLAPSTIANALRLLEAPKPVQDALRTQQIGAEHARVLLTLKDPGLASKVKIKPGVTVEELREDVAGINSEYATKGQGAVAAAKKALEDAQKKYPNATITWRAPQPSSYASHNLVDLTKALGNAPKPISGQIRGADQTWDSAKPTATAHDKACPCQSYQLTVRENYNRPAAALVFELEKVCTDPAGWKKARPKGARPTSSSSSQPKASKPPTLAQIAKQERAARERAAKEVARELAVKRPVQPRAAPLFKKLHKGSMTADVARAYVASEHLSGMGVLDEAGELLAWERIAAMPASKISDLAISMIADRAYYEIFNAHAIDPDSGAGRAAAHFGIKIAEPKKAKAKR
jgi:ParB/RepB/Spo0J family partition protein